MRFRQNGNALLIVLLLVLIIGAGGYYIFAKNLLNGNTATSGSVDGTSNIFNYGSNSAPVEAGNVASNNMSLTITSPLNGATLNSPSVTLSGKTSPNAEVFVNDKQTQADAKGNFSIKLNLDEGQNGLVITANDAEGNVVELWI